MAPVKLSVGDKRLLRMIDKDANEDGWALVGEPVFPLLESIPADLLVLVHDNNGQGWVRLTDLGKSIVKAMDWL